MSERLERVTAFSELREGMKVVCIGRCVGCDKETGCVSLILGDPGLPCACCRQRCTEITSCDGLPMCICPTNVRNGEVFRVVDGLGEPSTETAAASPTKQRTKETAS